MIEKHILIPGDAVKHGSFGEPGLDDDGYYSAGSDDFRAYVWKIPSTTDLLESRQVIPATDWEKKTDEGVIG